MEKFNKTGKKGGNKKEVAAAADEQPQREEELSHAREIARRAIFEFGAGLRESARGEGHPPEHQAGPSDPRLTRGSRALRGEERVVLSPVRKRRREGGVAAPCAVSGDKRLTRRERAEGYARTTAVVTHLKGLKALTALGELKMVRPSGASGSLRWDTRAEEFFRVIGDSFEELGELARSRVDERVNRLEQQVDSLRKELGRVRLELVRANRALGELGPDQASRTPRAAPLGGQPEAQSSAPMGAQQGGWVRVGKGGKPQKGAGQRVQLLGGVANPPPGLGAAAEVRQGGNALRGAPKGQKAAAGTTPQQPKKARRPKLPRNPAVLLTAVGGRSYASLLREAEEKVDLHDMGIDLDAGGGGLLVKRARNGGYLFEVPGKDGAAKADRFARELAEVLVGGAKVARPVKFAEMRVTGLVDGVTSETVVAAFMKSGECSRDDLTVGEIRRSSGGLGAMWLRCPLAAALKVEARKGLRIGWARVGVQLLEARPLQCYRCLKFGHLAAACTGPTDRKGRCFRCGGDGHVAKGCNADPRCLLCEKAGLSPGHRLGSRACPAAKAAWAKKGGRPDALRPKGTPGRSRGGKGSKAQATTAPAGGAVGPGAVFRVPDRPAPRTGGKEGGGDTRAPFKALVRVEVPPTEAEGAGLDDMDVVSCTQPPSGCESAQGEMAGEEEEIASSYSYLLESGMGDWQDSPPSGEM